MRTLSVKEEKIGKGAHRYSKIVKVDAASILYICVCVCACIDLRSNTAMTRK